MTDVTIQLDGGQALRVGPDRYEPDRWVVEIVRGNSSTVSEVSPEGALRLIGILRAGRAALARAEPPTP